MKTFISIFIILSIISCSGSKKILKSDIKESVTSKAVYYQNKSIKTDSTANPSTITSLLGIADNTIDSVKIWRVNNNEVKIQYGDSLQIKSLVGKTNKNGVFTVYLVKSKIDIPPLVPFLYSKRLVKKVKMIVNHKGELVIEYAWEDSHTILIFGGSNSRKVKYYFSKTKNSP